MKQHLTNNPPHCKLCRMLASPQNRVFPGLVVRISLKNDRVISQTELRAVVVQKLGAGSGKNNVGNTRHCPSQGLESYNLSTAFNLTRPAQQGNHLLTHILAMLLVSAACRDKTVVRQTIIISKQKVHEMELTNGLQYFCRELGQFELPTTHCPRKCICREPPKFVCCDDIRNVVCRFFCVVSIIEIKPLRCNHDWNQICVDGLHNTISLKFIERIGSTWQLWNRASRISIRLHRKQRNNIRLYRFFLKIIPLFSKTQKSKPKPLENNPQTLYPIP
jgi:hypothetical protein